MGLNQAAKQAMPTDFSIDPETSEIRDGTSNQAAFTVSEISQALKRTIEDRFGFVRVRGEISGYKGPHSSGHCYFSLKDEGARIDAVVWRGTFNRLRGRLQDGLEVVASGKLTSYPGKSSYQIVIENLEAAGAGALMALLEERRRKLAAEGLFDAARKKPLPFLPGLIGVVTSPTGAVIRDILHRLNDRFPRHVLVWPVRVQGETAAAEVVAAINGFNALKARPDLLIVARGGGSLEDLWPFNEEAVVRAVAASAIPVISAIGHETDTTLIDHVADWRAPTPTAAAERAVPVRADLMAELATLQGRVRRAARRYLEERRLRLRAARRALPKPDEVLAFARQRLDAAAGRLRPSLRANVQRHGLSLARVSGALSPRTLGERLLERRRRTIEVSQRASRALRQVLARRRDRMAAEAKLLHSLGYRSVLARGFAVVHEAGGRMLHSAAGVRPGIKLAIEFADGKVSATSEGGSRGSLF
jgi:exodeoxyribonuclease VII large subunit